MILRVRSLSLQKRGNAPAEYEDAFANDDTIGRFAVADGATESSFAAAWAKGLVEQYVARPIESTVPKNWQDWLAPLQKTWRAGIEWERLPWFAIDKAHAGAFSSLIGLEFFRPKPSASVHDKCLHWRAFAVGDSCLFHLRAGKLLTAFPLARAKEFNNRPRLLSSNPTSNVNLAEGIRVTGPAPANIGDRFLLATDALAEWFLRQHENGGHPAEELDTLSDPNAFSEWAVQQCAKGQMRNDDLTLMVVYCVPAEIQGARLRNSFSPV